MSASRAVAGLVLAAGASSRMGEPKVALEIDGAPMLTRVLRALKAGGCSPTYVVVGAPHDALAARLAEAEDATVVHNHEPSRGMLSSLQVGLASLDALAQVTAVAVALVDQPHLRARTVRDVLDAYARGDAPIVRPWIATPTGPRHGHPYVLARDVWPAVIAAVDPPEGMRSIFASFADSPSSAGAPSGVGGSIARVEVADPAILEDLDTPEDLPR